jgi:hypothetical protein
VTDDVNNFFMGNSAPSLSFLELGTVHEGRITHMTMVQARDMVTKEPKVWPDGNPKMQAIITLQTDERESQVEHDTGMRRLFVGSGGMRAAITAAIKNAHADGLRVGGLLGVKYVRDGDATSPGLNPPKVYAAKYEPPAVDEYTEDAPDLGEYSEEPF